MYTQQNNYITKQAIKVRSAGELANYYGFKEHSVFFAFLEKYFSKCHIELRQSGFREFERRIYTPAQQYIIQKYLGEPVYRNMKISELSKLYGYATTAAFKQVLWKASPLPLELHIRGWNLNKRVYISLWIEFTFLYMGTPEGAEKFLRKESV